MTDNDITTSKGVPSISRKTHFVQDIYITLFFIYGFDLFFVLALYVNVSEKV